MTISRNGLQCLILPMVNFQISQGNNGYFSHSGVNALDLCGKDTGAEPVIAPCDLRWTGWYDSYANGNAVWFESTAPVLFADGSVNYATFMFIHCNDISHILRNGTGHTYKQGDYILSEGTAGFATGNHTHYEVAKGKFQGTYALNRETGVYHLPGSISADQANVTDGANLINSGQPVGGCGNRMYWKKADQIPGVKKTVAGFLDVFEDDYYAEAVDWAKKKGIISGTSPSTFEPKKGLKRGDLALILYRLKGSPAVSGKNPFSDVRETDYYYKACLWLYQNSLTTESAYKPDSAATRGQAVTFIWRLAGSIQDYLFTNPFLDIHYPDYFFKPVMWAYKNGIVTGKTSTSFDPWSTCTRADFVTMLYRFSYFSANF